MPRNVFISYSHHNAADADWVQAFARSLAERGVNAWVDQSEIRPGESIPEAIERGLRESDMLVALVSNDSLNRPSLFFELGAALGMGKNVVGVVPEGFDSSLLPHPLRLRRYLVRRSPEVTAEELIPRAAA
ncbi:MAG TPA: toll/interleukin-1 receptor domain-containing protein [Longimicrobiaceae bacterium]|nr:toll/interleukin-1 receptor domain-containing protein [Longimicrobiaceae bacterium]